MGIVFTQHFPRREFGNFGFVFLPALSRTTTQAILLAFLFSLKIMHVVVAPS